MENLEPESQSVYDFILLYEKLSSDDEAVLEIKDKMLESIRQEPSLIGWILPQHQYDEVCAEAIKLSWKQSILDSIADHTTPKFFHQYKINKLVLGSPE